MVHNLLVDAATHSPDQPFLAYAGTQYTWAEAADLTRRIAGTLHQDTSRLLLYAADSPLLVMTALACAMAGREVVIVNRDFSHDVVGDLRQRFHTDSLITDDSSLPFAAQSIDGLGQSDPLLESPAVNEGAIIIMTTGTTGWPKAVQYRWSQLVAQVRPEDTDRRWLLAYPLNHFAGIQLLTHVMVNRHALVIPRSRHVSDVIDAIRTQSVDSISATPTFWRLLTGRLKAGEAPPLRQITLGGEPVTPDILDKLRRLFPQAAITQVYATTELGSCFSVTDGLPGFPRTYLERPVGNVELRVQDDRLYIRSQNRMLGYLDSPQPEVDDGWIFTGDMVEVSGDRVYFRGRENEVINVGGVKVFPLTVESAILTVEGVRAAHVYGRANPVTGQVVVADLELTPDVDAAATKQAVAAHLRDALSRYEQPRIVRVVEQIERRNEKIVRQSP